ncbi:hypothetical protein GOP47_0001267 [Adiantum capillus-veneris]|uniref:Uncharacterized protein n=1 Tax=Adiantum capillus-veneris TaxID=13818 RepID=A0A9D4VGK8_ADICA|nr:hypothetical protein GOP47_0001267 [Adiantum capillus-veneris]
MHKRIYGLVGLFFVLDFPPIFSSVCLVSCVALALDRLSVEREREREREGGGEIVWVYFGGDRGYTERGGEIVWVYFGGDRGMCSPPGVGVFTVCNGGLLISDCV